MDDEKQVVMEETRSLTFKDILFIIKKHWIAIIAFILLGGIAGFTWTKVQQTVAPVYQSTGIIMVSPDGNSSGQVNQNEYTLANNLTNTVVAFIKTNAVLDNVKETKPDFNIKSLAVTNASGNLMVTVKYTSKDPKVSKEMVDLVMDSAIEEANRMRTEDNKPVYHMLNDNLNIVDRAKDGIQTSHTVRNLAIGLAAGAALAFVYVFVREMLDNTFKSSEEIERTLNIPVLAGIPDYHFDDEKEAK